MIECFEVRGKVGQHFMFFETEKFCRNFFTIYSLQDISFLFAVTMFSSAKD